MKWKFLGKMFETKEMHKELFQNSKEDIEEKRWYQKTYSEINNILNPQDDAEPHREQRYSLDIDAMIEAKERLEKWMDSHLATTFQQDLMDRIAEKHMSPVDFYKAALLDRKLFSAMKNNVQYSPKKETAVACCLALRLDEKEAGHLLSKAGYQLTDSKRWDMIISYCIQHRIYDIDVVNNLLYHFEEKTIGV